jgi:alanine dehydrogenase
VTAIAYETITDVAGKLPLLSPMSKIAGRMAPQVAARFLERPLGDAVFSSAKWTVSPQDRLLLSVAGSSAPIAAQVALGMSADVFIVLRNTAAVNELTQRFGGRARVVTTAAESIAELCNSADVVIAAALVPGGSAPKLISAETVASDCSTDLIVMGGYGHSRLRQFVLGGVTRGMLESMTVPTLMAH